MRAAVVGSTDIVSAGVAVVAISSGPTAPGDGGVGHPAGWGTGISGAGITVIGGEVGMSDPAGPRAGIGSAPVVIVDRDGSMRAAVVGSTDIVSAGVAVIAISSGPTAPGDGGVDDPASCGVAGVSSADVTVIIRGGIEIGTSLYLTIGRATIPTNPVPIITRLRSLIHGPIAARCGDNGTSRNARGLNGLLLELKVQGRRRGRSRASARIQSRGIGRERGSPRPCLNGRPHLSEGLLADEWNSEEETKQDGPMEEGW